MTQALSEAALAAALAEEIYRRSTNDLPIRIADLGLDNFAAPDVLSGLQIARVVKG